VRIVLYAVSTPHASELLETVRRLGWEVAAAVRNLPETPVPPEVGEVVEVERLDPALLGLGFAVPQTDPAQRHAAIVDARRRGFTRAVTLVDPTATVASTARLGDGSYVGAGSVIGAGAVIGDACVVNRSCSVAHHVVFADCVGTGPGVVIAGSCRVDSGAFIGAGAVLAPELRVGEGALVGAGAVVVRPVAAGDVVVGNPARVLRHLDPVAGVPWG
jgi:sugar O-acyltransferase (sialic acid O-acetyltransferase NeuD family)